MRDGWNKDGDTWVLQRDGNRCVVMDAKDDTFLWKLILTVNNNKEIIRFPNMERAMIYGENELGMTRETEDFIILTVGRIVTLFIVVALAIFLLSRL